MSLFWLGLSYVVGSITTYFLFRQHIVHDAIENTIIYFVDQGFIASKVADDGEIELIKLKDYMSGIFMDENERRANNRNMV